MTSPTPAAQPGSRRRRRARDRMARPFLVGLFVLVVVLAGCGADVDDSTGFTDEETREAFLTACNTSSDRRLLRDLCECTYERMEEELDFADFADIEESLRLDALSTLPDSVLGLMADCFVEQVDL